MEVQLTVAEILAAVDEAEEAIARGEGIPITKGSMRKLAEDVKRREPAESRLRSEMTAPPLPGNT